MRYLHEVKNTEFFGHREQVEPDHSCKISLCHSCDICGFTGCTDCLVLASLTTTQDSHSLWTCEKCANLPQIKWHDFPEDFGGDVA